MSATVSIWIAFGAGILSFISPCTLPLFPSYIGYITGVSFQTLVQGKSRRVRWLAFRHALFFCLGLSILFVLLGYGATAFGRFLHEYKDSVRVVGGVFIIVMGLFMAGVLRGDWFMQERRLQFPRAMKLGYLGSFLVGVIFAAGWTPCIGPILSSVLILVMSKPSVGAWYMVAYAIGFSLPFLILAVTLTSLRPLLKYTEMLAKVGGWLLILMGVLLVTNQMTLITSWISQRTGFYGF